MFASLKELWSQFVENEVKTWNEFHVFWLNKRREIPILMVRYEDLLREKEVSA